MSYRTRISDALKRSFGIDLRTLAVFRIGLGILLITDLLMRARDLTAHYSDAGVLPREGAMEYLSQWRVSLYFANGTTDFQLLLFAIAGLAALLLLLGWRTRLMTFLSWVLLLSLQNRNPLLLQGGDNLLLLMLFWANFLPLGARFSVDAAMDTVSPKAPNQHFSVATVALLIQFMSVYFFSAFLKSGPEWMPLGNATFIALNTDIMVTPLGAWATQFPGTLQALTYFVWLLELIGPILIFSPVFFLPLRLSLMAMFISMHIGFLLCLKIGMFPFVSILSLITFTPGHVWDALARKLRTRERLGLEIFYDGDCDFCKKICLLMRSFLLLPSTPIRPAQDEPEVYALMERHNSWVLRDWDGATFVRWQALILLLRRSIWLWPFSRLLGTGAPDKSAGDRLYGFVARHRGKLSKVTAALLPLRRRSEPHSFLANGVAAVFLLIILSHNIASLEEDSSFALRGPFRAAFIFLHLDQKWNMFAPSPLRASKWVVAEAQTQSGESFSFVPMTFKDGQEPATGEMIYRYRQYRWRKFMNRISEPRREKLRPYLAAYLCRQLNSRRRGEDKVTQLSLVEAAIVSELEWISAQTYFIDKSSRREDLIEYQCPVKK